MKPTSISQFIDHHYRHFNAAAMKDAAHAYRAHLDKGGHMLVTLAGAMSTAELGLSLAEMIRRDKVHAICCTGANLEEDLFNLVAQKHYERIPRYRELTAQDEQALLNRHLNRVTDTCIPEAEAMRRIEAAVATEWMAADRGGARAFPHEFLYRLLVKGTLKESYQIDPTDSWMCAAGRAKPSDVCSGLGRFHAGQYVCGALPDRNHQECSHGAIRRRIHDALGRMVLEGGARTFVRILPNRRGDCRRFPHLCGSHAESRPSKGAGPALGIFLPDRRFNHQLRVVFRSRPE